MTSNTPPQDPSSTETQQSGEEDSSTSEPQPSSVEAIVEIPFLPPTFVPAKQVQELFAKATPEQTIKFTLDYRQMQVDLAREELELRRKEIDLKYEDIKQERKDNIKIIIIAVSGFCVSLALVLIYAAITQNTALPQEFITQILTIITAGFGGGGLVLARTRSKQGKIDEKE